MPVGWSHRSITELCLFLLEAARDPLPEQLPQRKTPDWTVLCLKAGVPSHLRAEETLGCQTRARELSKKALSCQSRELQRAGREQEQHRQDPTDSA